MREALILKFQDQDVRIIKVGGENCIPAEDLGRILGFSEPRIAVNKIFQRYRDELEPHTGVTKLVTPGGVQEVRVFNETGAYLVAMFARTPRAKEVRLWLASLPKRLREFREALQERMPLTLEDIRRVVREEMRGLCVQDEQALSLAREYGFFLGVKAALEVVRRYEQCNQRKKPASFLLSLMRYEAMGLRPFEMRRLLRCSANAIRRGRKKLRELGISPAVCQLPLFQKTAPQKEVN